MAESISDIIKRKSQQYGLPYDHMLKVAQLESGVGTAEGNKGGVYQFIPSTWKQYGQGDIADPEANVDAGMRFHKDVYDQMKQKLGREPTPSELYLGSMHGPAGAVALIQNPQQPAVGALAQFYKTKDDPSGYYGAKAALAGNAQTIDMTSNDVINAVDSRYNSKYIAGAGPGSQGGAQTAPVDPRDVMTAPVAPDDILGRQSDYPPAAGGLLGSDKDQIAAGASLAKAGLEAAAKASVPQQQRQLPPAPEAHIPQAQAPGNPDFLAMLQQRLQGQGMPQSPLDQLLAQKRLMGG